MLREQTVTVLLAMTMMMMSVADAKPDGVPQDACETMNPAHSRAPQSYPCPYALYPSKYHVDQNEVIMFTLEALPNRVIRGFMVQARYDNQNIIGQFFANNSRDVKVIDCCEGKQNTASHTSADPKRKIQMLWKAPQNYSGRFTFFVTAVESHGKFWVRVEIEKDMRIWKKNSVTA